MQRSYLYLLVTDYPYGIGEPFLENELFILKEYYERIYIIIPEIHLVDKSKIRFKIPPGVEIIELETRLRFKNKLAALLKWWHPSLRLELRNFYKSIDKNFNFFYFKLISGFVAMGIAFANELRSLVKRNGHNPDEVIFYSYWFTFATLGVTYLKEENLQYQAITRIHGWDCFYDRNPGNYLPLRPWAIKLLDKICPVSEQGKKQLMEKNPDADPSKIDVHYLGTKLIFSANNHTSFNPIQLRIVSISFVHHVKRINLIIDALETIEDIEIDWTHIGSWSPQTVYLKESAAKKLALKQNIHYRFTGEYSQTQVQQYLHEHNADFLICTSESEGIPVSMMEAMGYGIPILSTEVGGIPEIVKDGENGYLMPSDSKAKEIGLYIKRLASLGETEYLCLSENAKRTYLEKFQAIVNYESFAKQQLYCTSPVSKGKLVKQLNL